MGPARVGFLVYLLLWTAVLIPCVASGSGIRAVEDSWLLGSQPSGLAVWEVAMSQGKLFSFPELPQQSFSFQVAPQLWNRRVQLAGRWDSLGKGLFKDEKWRGELMVGSRLGLGVCLNGKRQQIESRMGQIQLDPLLVLQVRSGGQGSSFWLVKMDIPWDEPAFSGTEESRRSWLHLEFWQASWALALQLDRRPGGEPVLGLELLWRPEAGVGFSLRVDPASGAMGPGLRLQRGSWFLRSSHLVHPFLGQTHRLGLVFSRHEK